VGVGWWEELFVKVAGCFCKNDTHLEYPLLSIEMDLVKGLKCKINERGCCAIWTFWTDLRFVANWRFFCKTSVALRDGVSISAWANDA
jgi:hypothetical protein